MTILFPSRSSEPLLSVLMWGVNHTVRELQHVHIPVMLMPDDFRSFSKIKVDNHAFNKENLPSQRQCAKCGYLSSIEVCKACLLLEGLNKGIPKLGVGKSTKSIRLAQANADKS